MFSITNVFSFESKASKLLPHTVALDSLRDALKVEIEGAIYVENETLSANPYCHKSDRKRIRNDGIFDGRKVVATDRIHPETAPGGSNEVLPFYRHHEPRKENRLFTFDPR